MYNGKITLWSFLLSALCSTHGYVLSAQGVFWSILLFWAPSVVPAQKMLERGEGNEGSRTISVCVKYC